MKPKSKTPNYSLTKHFDYGVFFLYFFRLSLLGCISYAMESSNIYFIPFFFFIYHETLAGFSQI